jgi:hypothetical protein
MNEELRNHSLQRKEVKDACCDLKEKRTKVETKCENEVKLEK